MFMDFASFVKWCAGPLDSACVAYKDEEAVSIEAATRGGMWFHMEFYALALGL
jgi:hypothetical protein